MALYQRVMFPTNTTISQATLEVIAGSVPFSVLKVGVTLLTGVASTFVFGRPAAIGITPTAPVGIPALGFEGAFSQATRAFAWGTSPTQPTAGVDGIAFPATVGSFREFTFPSKSFVIKPGQSVVLFNTAANGTVQVSMLIEE